ncbi:MAG: exo 1,3/1,4-beta-D-glucan glucohydrolase [Gammaproteobacteria bacterium]|nr:exo 1,3/1,4-beta-D-glucan glucohydrolase [Gammaproteobacteria bacterium]
MGTEELNLPENKYLGLLALFCALSLISSCNQENKPTETHITDISLWPQVSNPVQASAAETAKIESLLAGMSLEEKVGQIMQAEIIHITPEEIKKYHIGSVLNGGTSKPNQNPDATASEWLAMADAFYDASMDTTDGNAAIPVIWGTDAVHGHALVKGATIFPHNIGLGATRNPELVKQIGDITARELHATGINWAFAPTVAVAQNDRWGRTYESYSEDPDIVKQLAAAMVAGLQGNPADSSFLDDQHVVATAKHFIGDGGTLEGDDQGNTRISEQELVTIHNPGYVASIQAGVQTIMASFSSWNGDKLHGNHYLLTKVLKNRMGFDGLVVGDWNGHGQLRGCTNSSCAAAINAGVDLIMVTRDWKAMIRNTLTQVRSGEISEQRLDDAVRRILRVKLRAGLFEHRPSDSAAAKNKTIVGHPQHRAVARQAVRESLVLLKNRNGILPLDPRQTILVAGDGANDIGKQCGGWSMHWQGSHNNEDFPGATSIYEGIRETVNRAGGKTILSVDGSYKQKPDVAIVVFGEDPYAEGLGDLNTIEFEAGRKKSLALLKKLSAENIPVISIFLSGRPLWVNPELNASDAFVAAWLPGSEGAGVADVLFTKTDGVVDYDFKGKLSFSWPKNPSQEILNPHHSHYDPLFGLGYSLTYASAQKELDSLEENFSNLTTANPAEIPLYIGKALEPWRVYIRNQQHRQILSGAFAATPDGDVLVSATDKDIQGDALTLAWNNTQHALLYFTDGQPIDLSSYLPDGVITFDLKVESKNIDNLALMMRCGEDCERRFSLTQYANTQAAKNWKTVAIKLSCLARPSDRFGQISLPFALEGAGSGEVSLANIKYVIKGQENLTCQKTKGEQE